MLKPPTQRLVSCLIPENSLKTNQGSKLNHKSFKESESRKQKGVTPRIATKSPLEEAVGYSSKLNSETNHEPSKSIEKGRDEGRDEDVHLLESPARRRSYANVQIAKPKAIGQNRKPGYIEHHTEKSIHDAIIP